MNDQYRFDAKRLAERVAEMRGQVGGELLPVMLRSIRDRVKQSGYLEFGPCWWAIKAVLNDNGYNLGQTIDQRLAERYTYYTPEMTAAAAWEAADSIRATHFAGSRDFDLDDLGEETYTLFDPDQEIPR